MSPVTNVRRQTTHTSRGSYTRKLMKIYVTIILGYHNYHSSLSTTIIDGVNGIFNDETLSLQGFIFNFLNGIGVLNVILI